MAYMIPASYEPWEYQLQEILDGADRFRHFHQEGPPIELPLPIVSRDTNKTWIENGTSILQLITPERAQVIDWIKAHIPEGPVTIGMSLEHEAETGGDEKADVITLYIKDLTTVTKGHCLSYQISRDRICDEMRKLLNQDCCTFVGKKSANGIKDMRMLIKSKMRKDNMAVGGIAPEVKMTNMFECGPAEMYLEGARQLLRRYSTEEVPFNWRARIFTGDQARYTCLNALVGWLFTRGQPPQLLTRGKRLQLLTHGKPPQQP